MTAGANSPPRSVTATLHKLPFRAWEGSFETTTGVGAESVDQVICGEVRPGRGEREGLRVGRWGNGRLSEKTNQNTQEVEMNAI